MRDVRSMAVGVRVHRFRHRLHVVQRHGLPVTGPEQTFVHLARLLDLVDLVVLGDRLVKRGVTTPAQLLSYSQGWEGQCRRQAVRGAGLVRERVDSEPETRLRLLMVLAGLPEPEVDIQVVDADGQIRYRLDSGFRAQRLAIEYDGRWHDTPEQRERDEERRSNLRGEGWSFLIVTADDLFGQPAVTLTRLATAMVEHGIRVPSRLSDEWRSHYLARGVRDD
jgi:hypothetical protein